jgi:hypothetical protein
MNTNLRPIGTVFTHVFPASMNSTNPHPHKATFRVVAHVPFGDGFGGTHLGEETVCVAMDELPAPDSIPLEAFKSAAHYRDWQQAYAEKFA